MTKSKTGKAALADTLEQLRLEGLAAAYRRGIAILNDDEAPATAYAQLVRVFFSASGLGTPAAEEPPVKDHADMSPEELDEALREARIKLAAAKAGGEGGSVFA